VLAYAVSSTTALLGVYRFETMDEFYGFWSGAGHPIAETGGKAYTTDASVGLAINIYDTQDGEALTWRFIRPDATDAVSHTCTYDLDTDTWTASTGSVWQGDPQNPYLMDAGWIVAKQLSNYDMPGNWTIDLLKNGTLLYEEHFELVPKPAVSIARAVMVKIPPSFADPGLGVNLAVEFPSSDNPDQLRYVKLGANINGVSVSSEFDVTDLVAAGESKTILWNDGQFVGHPLIVLDFGALGIPRFETDQTFDLTAEAWTSDGLANGLKSDTFTHSVGICLPVVIVHGYLFPGAGSRLLGKIVAPAVYDSLTNYLENNYPADSAMLPFTTGYTTDASPYQTVWFKSWSVTMTPGTVATWLDTLIGEVRSATYADRVNLVCHSLGGLIARYYVCYVGPSRVHKVIMIGTPNSGTSVFYEETSGWSASTVMKSGASEPLGLWAVPRYKDALGASFACIYDAKTSVPLWPSDALIRPSSSFTYPEAFADLAAPPAGVSYTTIYSTSTATHYLLNVTPLTRKGATWYKVNSVKSSVQGDGIVAVDSALLPSAVPVPIAATQTHGTLPMDTLVQEAVLTRLHD
jgi:pimeloyl-ACP methyl ester carboxylesterase